MLEYLAGHTAHRQVLVVHTDRSPETHPLRDRLFDLATRLPALTLRVRYSAQTADGEHAGFDLDGIELPADADFILCGPTGFLSAVRSALLERGVPADRVRTEQFDPTDWRDGNG
jgi:nitric oxide dioxygenase